MSSGILVENESENDVIDRPTDMSYRAAVTVSERIRQRLKDAMDERDMSQRELAELLTHDTGQRWTQSKVGKILTGYVELRIEDLDAIARCVGISLCEAVRDPGLEFYAEMTPTELRLFQWLQRKPVMLDAVLTLLGVPKGASDTAEMRHLPAKPKRGRPLDSSRKADPLDDVKGGASATTAHRRPRPK